MCTGLAVAGIGAALAAAGTAAKVYSNNQRSADMKDAANKTLLAGYKKQKSSDQKKQQALGDILSKTAGADTLQQQMDRQAQQRLDAITSNQTADQATNQGHYAPPSSADNSGQQVVQDAFNSRTRQNHNTLASENRAMANLSSLGDAYGAMARQTQPLRNRINAYNSFQRGDARLLPLEVNQAVQDQSNSHQGLNTIGTIASIIGTAMMGYGAAGVGAAGGAAGGASAGGAGGTITGAGTTAAATSMAVPDATLAASTLGGTGAAAAGSGAAAGAGSSLGNMSSLGTSLAQLYDPSYYDSNRQRRNNPYSSAYARGY